MVFLLQMVYINVGSEMIWLKKEFINLGLI